MRDRTALLVAATLIAGSLTAKEPDTQPAAGQSIHKQDVAQTVAGRFPRLASSGLLHAGLANLPEGLLLRCGQVRITQRQLNAEVANAPEALRGQLRKSAFFLLEQMATQELLLAEAKAAMSKAGMPVSTMTASRLLKKYVESLVEDLTVTDAEARAFYDENRGMVGGATFQQVEKQIRQYLLGQKRQTVLNQHLATLGKRMKIEVDAAWTAQQAALAADNPVDKARNSGRPSLVDFGADGCRPCEMMTPILKALKEKYKGRLNVEFVHVRQEQILAARYGIRSIPVQVFFDASGKEVFRHTGFYPQAEIEKKLAELGVD